MDRTPEPMGLDPTEARVLGCLIEKESTTPDAYPLTVNGLRTACNQSTSRQPVMALTDHDVQAALDSLRERCLTRTVHSTSNRAAKFRHVLPDVLDLDPGEAAVISVLLLRGAQTIGELKIRTDRQHSFGSTDDVASSLHALAARDEPLVRRLDRQPGQKDARWVELLSLAPPSQGEPARPSDVGHGDAVDAAASDDPYGAATAEFYDLLATAHWESFGYQLLDLLADADPAAGPIVDVGAGTGVGLPYLAAAVPGVRIHAVEPSRAMRTALHTRLAIDAELRRATTVDPRPWGSAALPERACALVVSAALGHLDDDERARLWRFVAERMPAGAPAVIEMLPPDRSEAVPRTRYRELHVGGYVYEGWQRGEPVDDRVMDWTMDYRVLDGDRAVAEYTVRSRWTCFGVGDVLSEIEPYGLQLTRHDDSIVVRR
ncbi:MAG: DUF480 domain-containing protein [Ilumatobacteraceae bacterium]